jgi:DNA repair protein RadA/Sms
MAERRRPRGYVCVACGHRAPKWLGRCPGCGEWATLVEEAPVAAAATGSGPTPVAQAGVGEVRRLDPGTPEFTRLLGGGFVPGSVVLVAGDPGIGKSTLALLAAAHIARSRPVLYASGEESLDQLGQRARRLGAVADQLYVTTTTEVETLLAEAARLSPALLVVDSVQTAYRQDLPSAPGSPVQVREVAQTLARAARERGLTVLLIGQATKEAAVAGPRLLEHIVDVVLAFEGNRGQELRALRALKNRFGAAGEVALFEMRDGGLVEIANPSRYLLEERSEGVPGAVIVGSARGSRPLFSELQALVSPVPDGVGPRHQAIGLARERLELVVAVLQRWTPYRVAFQNVFVSLAGGFESDDPALDLGMAVALASSAAAVAVRGAVLFAGEVTLSGEVRSVPDLERLVAEAERLGLEAVVAARRGLARLDDGRRVRLHGVGSVAEAVEWMRSQAREVSRSGEG